MEKANFEKTVKALEGGHCLRLVAGKPKRHYRGQFSDSSTRLFNSAWNTYLKYLNGAIDNPRCEQDVIDWLNCIIGEKVNNSKSKFYIYG